MNLGADSKPELLVVGSYSQAYTIGQVVVKVPRIDDEAEITQENAGAMVVETNVYKILGCNERIATCLYISPTRDMLVLEYYTNGNLKDYVSVHGPIELRKWARQMIESVRFIHSKGVRHSDIRLDQWLVDSALNARLSDFNASGHDDCPALSISSMKAVGNEDPRHFMPRDPAADNTTQSDLFALGSALYELECGTAPLAEVPEERVSELFALKRFPSVLSLELGAIIMDCWEGRCHSASDALSLGERLCTL